MKKYYQLRRPIYSKYGFEGFEDYREPLPTIEYAREMKRLSVFSDIKIFEITVEERIVE